MGRSAVSSAQYQAHRKCADTADERRLDTARPAGRHDPLSPTQQLREQRAHLHPRQLLPDADMRAASERDMPVRLAIDHECIGVLKHRLVTVAGMKEQRQRLAGTDRLAVELRIARGGAHEVTYRRGPA